MAITIKDIAKQSGVGISTVSRVINNTGYVSEEVRQKVMRVVRDCNYVPNTSARNLKVNGSKNIALLVKGITNPFFNKMIRIIEEKAALRGYPLFIQNVDDHANELDIATREARDRNLCGVIIMGGTFGYSEQRFRQLGIPCVLVTVSASEAISKDLYSSVKIDDEKESYRATEYLISLGHKRIGFIYDPLTDRLTPNRLRFMGYCRALEEYNIPFDASLVADNTSAPLYSGYITGFNAMKSLYMRNHDMTAVFAFADVLAIGAAKGAFSLGLRVPEDMSIVGFDGIEASEFYQPSLDTVYQPASEMALSSIEFLFDMLQGGKPQHLVYDAVLMKRGSCQRLIK
ncbi:MAG: LacI family DNA-binding transcriptional regulator [Christensenella sp.]